jgi:hypothetical protein
MPDTTQTVGFEAVDCAGPGIRRMAPQKIPVWTRSLITTILLLGPTSFLAATFGRGKAILLRQS